MNANHCAQTLSCVPASIRRLEFAAMKSRERTEAHQGINRDGLPMLHNASKVGDMATIRALLEGQVDPNEIDKYGNCNSLTYSL